MPFYTYTCKHCNKKLEVMQKMSDKPLKECPACGEDQLCRLILPPAVHFIGTGWTPKGNS